MAGTQFCPIGKLEKVLVASDRSRFSEGAIQESINFAKRCGSSLYVLCVLETNPEYETIGANVFEIEEKEVSDYLQSIKSLAAKEGIRCETFFHEAMDAAQSIVDEAAAKQVDMVVVGRHGRTGLIKALMGNVASKVIARAPCKVLVVPKAARIEYKNILVATDGSIYSQAAVTEALAIAKRCGSNVIALSAIRDNSELKEAEANVDKVVESGKTEGINVEAITPQGKAHDVIVEIAGGRAVDLIVMGTYGKSGVKKLLMGSSTEKVIGSAGCAVLVVKGNSLITAA